jgi:N-acetylglucosamine kinase-like BadF-type ATPase
MSEYFLGVDGGQSSTVAVIGDEHGRMAGWATAGPCNHVAAEEARARFTGVIGECVAQAAARAGLDAPRPHFRAACLGMSGGPDDKEALLGELIDAEHVVVTHDARIALAGALSGAPGIVVIAGTGSIAFGENATGETARAGGWGYIYGDEGGAFDIARQAVRATLREHEGWGAHTALTPALLESTGCSDPNEMLHRLYTPEWPRARVATLARVVNRIAESGDRVAIDVMNSAGQHLALLAAAVRRQLFREDEGSRLSWIGGVFESSALLGRFRSLIELEGTVTMSAPEHAPSAGALMLAYRAAGLRIDLSPSVTLDSGKRDE